MLILLLAVLASVGWVTEWMAAWVGGECRGRTVLIGLLRKAAMFAVVAIAHLIDRVLGDLNMFREAAVFFYLANELGSVIVNMGRIGVPLPDFLRGAAQFFQYKSNSAQGSQAIAEKLPDAAKPDLPGDNGETPDKAGNKISS